MEYWLSDIRNQQLFLFYSSQFWLRYIYQPPFPWIFKNINVYYTNKSLFKAVHNHSFNNRSVNSYLRWNDPVIYKFLRCIMAILRKPVGYVNSSCVTLMWWVKTLRQSKRKIIVRKVSCHDSLLVVLFNWSYYTYHLPWTVYRVNLFKPFLFLSKKVKVVHSCPTLCDPMEYTLHGILQARILEWVVFPFSRGSF